jgi:hypothetical protein
MLRGMKKQDISLQSLLPAIGSILGRTDEHFHKIVVQGIVELALKAPFKLRVVQVARMKIEIVSVYREGWIFELDNHFHAFPFCASGKIQQWVLIEAELREDAVEATVRRLRHPVIVR